MNATTKPPIERHVPTKEVAAILDIPGGPLYGSPWHLPLAAAVLPSLTVEFVRETAAKIAASKGRIIAASSAYNRWVEFQPTVDALLALADRAERRPAEHFDRLNISDSHRGLLRTWADRCNKRSALLEPLHRSLDELWTQDQSHVHEARSALSMLADADLLLPGIDAELRPILTIYAGLEES